MPHNKPSSNSVAQNHQTLSLAEVWVALLIKIPFTLKKKKMVVEFPSGAAEMNPTRNHMSSIPGLDQWAKDAKLL